MFVKCGCVFSGSHDRERGLYRKISHPPRGGKEVVCHRDNGSPPKIMCSNYWNEAALGDEVWWAAVYIERLSELRPEGLEKPKIYILEMLFPFCLTLNFPIPRFVSNFFFLPWRWSTYF